MCILFTGIEKCSLQTVRKKFSLARYSKVALIRISHWSVSHLFRSSSVSSSEPPLYCTLQETYIINTWQTRQKSKGHHQAFNPSLIQICGQSKRLACFWRCQLLPPSNWLQMDLLSWPNWSSSLSLIKCALKLTKPCWININRSVTRLLCN